MNGAINISGAGIVLKAHILSTKMG